MKANALYTTIEHNDGRVTHGIVHDGGEFAVSSKEVGVALQNFLQYATASDLAQLHSHLLYAYHRAQSEQEKFPVLEE